MVALTNGWILTTQKALLWGRELWEASAGKNTVGQARIQPELANYFTEQNLSLPCCCTSQSYSILASLQREKRENVVLSRAEYLGGDRNWFCLFLHRRLVPVPVSTTAAFERWFPLFPFRLLGWFILSHPGLFPPLVLVVFLGVINLKCLQEFRQNTSHPIPNTHPGLQLYFSQDVSISQEDTVFLSLVRVWVAGGIGVLPFLKITY